MSSAAGPSSVAARAKRPANRRELILTAAGEAFEEFGYHGASMEEIAARVGITAAALYRHFANKYVLFAECTRLMIDDLLAGLDALPADSDLETVLRTVATRTLTQRNARGVHRWEARYLEPSERADLRLRFARLVGAVTERVNPPQETAQLRAVAALGVIGSVTVHRTRLARGRAVDLLTDTALRVATSSPTLATPPPHLPPRPAASTRRSQLIAAAIELFAAHGYHQVSTAQIATAVGLSNSGIYRHFPTKADILASACLQAATHLEAATLQALTGSDTPADQLKALAAAHVAYSFENTDLISVAEGELVGLPADLKAPVLAAQRDHLSHWESVLGALHPGADARTLRTLTHAGFGVVVEAGRHLRWQDSPAHRQMVTGLLAAALSPPA